MTPLKLDPQGLPNGLADVQPGDAVVAFNRRSIYNARRVRGTMAETLKSPNAFHSLLMRFVWAKILAVIICQAAC
jgi:hypothetical protein